MIKLYLYSDLGSVLLQANLPTTWVQITNVFISFFKIADDFVNIHHNKLQKSLLREIVK